MAWHGPNINMADPSPRRNPSRLLSNGLVAFSGVLLQDVLSAWSLQNPAMERGLMHAFAPTHIITPIA